MLHSLGEFSSSRVRAVYTTRDGGTSTGACATFNLGSHVADDPQAVEANRAILAHHLPAAPLWLNQVHGTVVVEANFATVSHEPAANLPPPLADASVTAQSGGVLAILTADCLPVIFATDDGSVIAAAHAGWRGLQAGVLENTVQAMRRLNAGAPIEARFGAAIGPAHFEVGDEVYHQFCAADSDLASGFVGRQDRWLANLYWLAQRRLERCAVTVLDGPQWCTYAQPERFFSYRRDGNTGRQATLVWLARS